MRSFAGFLFFIFMSCVASGQVNKKMNIPSYGKGDTTFWYEWQLGRDNKTGLPHLTTSTDTFHFRIWLDGQAVDIMTADYKTFTGILTNYIDSYEETNKKTLKSEPAKTFYTYVLLDTASARKTFELIKTVSSIPSQDSVAGWSRGCDGITYIFETSMPSYYSFKSYWTPGAQKSTLTEAIQIQNFVDTIVVLLNLKEEQDKFHATLKSGAYSLDHFGVMFIPSERQKKKWKKYEPHWNYLQSINDTLNNYLSDTLTKIFIANTISIDFRQYFLIFSRHNRLKKIKTNHEFIDFESRIEFYRDKRKIRKAFRKVRIDFVHAKRRYGKELGYWEGKVLVY